MKREIVVKINGFEFWFWPCLTVIALATTGETSLIEAIVHALMAVEP